MEFNSLSINKNKGNILYISWDGISEPLGISQIISYLEKLSDEFKIHIFSFEKGNNLKNKELQIVINKRLSKAGINWKFYKYHKKLRPLSTLYDVIKAMLYVIKITRKYKIDIIHVRSYIPLLIAIPSKLLYNKKLLFDIRGFWPDEKVDGGSWSKRGLNYNLLKKSEKLFYRLSDHIVTLTDVSVPIIKNFNYWEGIKCPPITVIRTCTNLDAFQPKKNDEKNRKFVLGYLGSFGSWYLLKETLIIFKEISEILNDAEMLICNLNEHEKIKLAAKEESIDLRKISLIKANHYDVPLLLQRMSATVSLIRPCFSKLSSSPTKLGEYLGCGLPCIGNKGVGDVDKILQYDNAGIVLENFDRSSLKECASQIIDLSREINISRRCRNTALKFFSLDDGVSKYRLIYKEFLKKN